MTPVFSGEQNLIFRLRATSVLAFLFKTPTQKLKMLISAKKRVERQRNDFSRCGFPKGIRPFGSFLGYFLGKTKK